MIKTWKILQQHDDVCEKTWFTRINSASTASTRLNSSLFNLEMKRANMEIRKNLFSIRVVNGWNQLPEAVKGSMTLYSFKNSYDEHRNAAMDPE